MAGMLVLGEVTFNDFELPEHLSIGGKQQLVIHTLPGGGRVVDAMGASEGPIRWSGIFSGQQAAERVRTLERLRRAGGYHQLVWDAWRYTVIIQQFEAQISSNWWIPYKIGLCVITADRVDQPDWLDRANSPALSIGLLGAAALESAIGIAALGLGASDVRQAIGSAGALAQYVTARAYGAFAS